MEISVNEFSKLSAERDFWKKRADEMKYIVSIEHDMCKICAYEEISNFEVPCRACFAQDDTYPLWQLSASMHSKFSKAIVNKWPEFKKFAGIAADETFLRQD